MRYTVLKYLKNERINLTTLLEGKLFICGMLRYQGSNYIEKSVVRQTLLKHRSP